MLSKGMAGNRKDMRSFATARLGMAWHGPEWLRTANSKGKAMRRAAMELPRVDMQRNGMV